jgi:hypothetical protein
MKKSGKSNFKNIDDTVVDPWAPLVLESGVATY